ncbi:histidine-specific methyltransferase [Xylaria sp. CBS 124048]|nr:histidine-specific methyltransferase [Xylaria sp. CBS 124048]
MSPSKLEVEDQPFIIDIRRGHSIFDPTEEVNIGLRSQPPALPSLFLWDDQGQKCFDRLSQTPTYYPFHSEIEILQLYGANIGASVPADGMLLELGCGAIRKTKLVLSGLRKLQKPVHYFALDVSHESLAAGVQELRDSFHDSELITITGLLGTYDDGVAWLNELKCPGFNPSVTIMWLGNSMCNMDNQHQASDFLARFRTACQESQLACRFIVSTDICQKDAKVQAAYNVHGPELRGFLFSALEVANQHLACDVFSYADWMPYAWLDDYDGRTLHVGMVPSRDVSVPLLSADGGAETVVIPKGQLLYLISSGKWSEGDMGAIAGQAGFSIQQRWKDGDGDYCVFLLA